MANRVQLQTILEDLMSSSNVYYQPPESVKLRYPCVIYSRSSIDTTFADDKPYVHRIRYKITIIDKNPDSELPGKVAALPMCVFDRHYVADNLNHDVYNLYY